MAVDCESSGAHKVGNSAVEAILRDNAANVMGSVDHSQSSPGTSKHAVRPTLHSASCFDKLARVLLL